MSKIHEVAPHVWWLFEQVQAKFPQANIKMRWDAIAEGFVIATDDSALLYSKEYSEFTWQLEDEIFHKSPFLLYFTFDSELDIEDYNIDDININVEKYTMGAPKELEEPSENGVAHSTDAQEPRTTQAADTQKPHRANAYEPTAVR